ncbi:MAG TPA: cytochrome c [Bryobacteraceae bacterium]|nr:cytochrome c [Bryobacteraceae bacterium]
MRSYLTTGLATAAALLLAGCSPSGSRNSPVVIFTDMDYQHRYEPQGDRSFNGAKPFFGDDRASRRPVEGTIAVGHLVEDDSFATGVLNNSYVGRNPMPVTADLVKHGQARFNTYCAPCHDRTGQGRGLVGQRAMWIPTNLLEPRVRDMNDGEIFNVITNGRRSMPPYKYQVVDRDRWAIVAYVRALQRASGASEADVPADQRAGLK